MNEVCHAVITSEELGVLHYDLTQRNIYIMDDGPRKTKVVLADFGEVVSMEHATLVQKYFSRRTLRWSLTFIADSEYSLPKDWLEQMARLEQPSRAWFQFVYENLT